MKWWPFTTQRDAFADVSLDTLITRLEAAFRTVSGVSVTPETCMESPTVHAIVTAVSRRISVSPVRVMQKTFDSRGREKKELLPNHPVARLLSAPNEYQSRTNYWLDATSVFLRYGRFYAYKSRGSTGPVRGLQPIRPSAVTVTQDDQTLAPRYRATLVGGAQRDIPADRMHHVRGAARDFLEGDSPVLDVREAIAHEIALERHGASLFGNGAFPFLLFNIAQGFKGFVDKKEEEAFIASIKSLSGGRRAHSGFFMPKGIEAKEILTPNDQAQFIESRKHQRTVIAAAFGVPPHLVGDLERATFNNVEQQDTDFVINVVMPIAQAFESAMERDLLTDEDRRSGVIVRFNLDAVQRADFKSRQEGLQIQRQNGAINANEWREADGRNPIAEKDGGEEYIRPANMQRAGEVPPNGSNGAPSSPRDQRGGAQDPPN